MASLSAAAALPSPRRIEAQAVLCTVVLALVAFCVVFPLFLVVLQSFQVAAPGEAARYGLDGWRAALGEPGLRGALWNTFTVTFVRQLLSLPLAVLIAWLLARTDLPGRSWIEFSFWAAFFLPSFTVTLSWILLLDPEYGLVNTALAALPFVGKGPFNIYSFWGIVWVHIVTGSLTVKVILLTPAFAKMNASFEEASRVGAAARHDGVAADLRGRAGARPALPLLRVQHDDLRPARDARAALRRGHRARRPRPRRDAAPRVHAAVADARAALHHSDGAVPEPAAQARSPARACPRPRAGAGAGGARRAGAPGAARHLHEALRLGR